MPESANTALSDFPVTKTCMEFLGNLSRWVEKMLSWSSKMMHVEGICSAPPLLWGKHWEAGIVGHSEVPWYFPVILLLLCVISLRGPNSRWEREIVTKENRTEQMWNVTITGKRLIVRFLTLKTTEEVRIYEKYKAEFRSCWFLLYVL